MADYNAAPSSSVDRDTKERRTVHTRLIGSSIFFDVSIQTAD